MRTCATWILPVVLVGLAAVTGCVPGEKLKEAENANRILQQEKSELEARNESLRSRLSLCQSGLAAKEDDLRRLRDINQNLQLSVSRLEDDLSTAVQKYRDAIQGKMPPELVIRPLPEKLNKALAEFAAKYPGLIDYSSGRGMIKFTSDLTFGKGSIKVSEDAKDALGKLAEILKANEAEKFMVFIAGHTDDIPIKSASTKGHSPTNWYLSVHRAVAVQQVLTETHELNPHRVAVMGFGEYHPIAPNKPNDGGNEKNRRVELWIVPAGQFLTADAVTIPTDTEGK
ncbi:MAG: OmpA family protein [Phycisphaerae bacterium]